MYKHVCVLTCAWACGEAIVRACSRLHGVMLIVGILRVCFLFLCETRFLCLNRSLPFVFIPFSRLPE